MAREAYQEPVPSGSSIYPGSLNIVVSADMRLGTLFRDSAAHEPLPSLCSSVPPVPPYVFVGVMPSWVQ